MVISENTLVVDRLTKTYGNLIAVDNVSFCIQPNTCFALLGPNGSGKTSLFKMLTGELQIVSGCVYINGFDVKNGRTRSFREFGYCPQANALLGQLTGHEILMMYARLRGIPEKCIEYTSNHLLQLLGIESYRDKKVGGYSGGTKRKLSVAIALIGSPPIVIMDEPSSGLDPQSRLELWDIIRSIKESGTAVLLTSHSMEEANALCDNLAIIVNGRIVCLGG